MVLLSACRQEYPQGEQIYKAYCVNCHMEDGSGLALLIPPLADADYLRLYPDSIPCIIREGRKGGLTVNGTLYHESMPSARNLNEVELSNLINYINTAWGNDNPVTHPAEVRQRLTYCAGN